MKRKAGPTNEGPEEKKRRLLLEQEEMNALYDGELAFLLKSTSTSVEVKNIIIVGRLLELPNQKLYELVSRFSEVESAHLNLKEVNPEKFAETFLLMEMVVQQKIKSNFLLEFESQDFSIQNQYNLFGNILMRDQLDQWIENAKDQIAVEQAVEYENLADVATIDAAVEKENIKIEREKKKEKLTPEQQKKLDLLQGRVERFLCNILKFNLTETEEAVDLLKQHFSWDEYALFDDKISNYNEQLKALLAFENACAKEISMETFKEFLIKTHPLAAVVPNSDDGAMVLTDNLQPSAPPLDDIIGNGTAPKQQRVITPEDYEENNDENDALIAALLDEDSNAYNNYTPARNNIPVAPTPAPSMMQSVTEAVSSVVESVRSKINYYLS